jgi:hypothetical protein
MGLRIQPFAPKLQTTQYQPKPALQLGMGGGSTAYQGALDYSKTPYSTGNEVFDKMPTPGYAPGYDPNSMGMESKYKELMPQFSGGLNKVREAATMKGPSPWAMLMQNKNNLLAQTNKESAARSANAGTAESLSQLASSGGLTSGARERAIEAGQKNKLGMQQDLTRQNMLSNLTADIQDQSERNNLLSMVPGMEQNQMNGWLNAFGQDGKNQMSEMDKLNQFNQNLYNQRMAAAAAKMQADATRAAGAPSDAAGINLPGIGRVDLGMGGPALGGDLGWAINPVGRGINEAGDWLGDRLGISW